MELTALAGNAQIKAQLAHREGDLAHAYIVAGPAGSGRHTLAAQMAAALVCSAQPQLRPCGRCSHCRKAAGGIHPDITVIAGSGGKPITVDQVRALRTDAYVRPNEAERKVYLLERADRMNASAQNAMLKLLEEDLPMDVVFVFTAQEEVGTRGAFGAAFSVAPETALVLETTTAADLPGVEGHRRVCAPGRGPVISYMDGGTIYDRGLFEDLRRLAEDNGIPWQTKEYIAGGNDARTIQRSRAGVRVAALSAAVRYLHAPASVGSLADFEDMLALTRLFVADQAARL